MSENTPCQGIRDGDKTICSIHKVELVTQYKAREMGLTNDQPFLDSLVCPVSGAMFSSANEVDDLLSELE